MTDIYIIHNINQRIAELETKLLKRFTQLEKRLEEVIKS
jgi:hypothetical protein